MIDKLIAESFAPLPGTQCRVAGFAEQHSLGRRAGDALRFAVTSERGVAVHTLSQRLAGAGLALSVLAQSLA